MIRRFASILMFVWLASPSFGALIHYYDFNGSAVTDLVGTANATLSGDATVSGGVLNLDGDGDSADYATKIVPVTGDFTVAMTVKQTILQSGIHIEVIAQGSSGGPGFYIGHDPSHNFRLGDAWITTGIPFPFDGNAHQFVLTKSGSLGSFYIDGALIQQNGSYAIGGSDNTHLGKQFSPFGEFFAGTVDDLLIFDTALTDQQIADGLTGVPEPVTMLLLAGGMCAFRSRRRIA